MSTIPKREFIRAILAGTDKVAWFRRDTIVAVVSTKDAFGIDATELSFDKSVVPFANKRILVQETAGEILQQIRFGEKQ